MSPETIAIISAAGTMIIVLIAIAGFLWNLHLDMDTLRDRVSRLEGLLEGLRDAISGRAPARG